MPISPADAERAALGEAVAATVADGEGRRDEAAPRGDDVVPVDADVDVAPLGADVEGVPEVTVAVGRPAGRVIVVEDRWSFPLPPPKPIRAAKTAATTMIPA